MNKPVLIYFRTKYYYEYDFKSFTSQSTQNHPNYTQNSHKRFQCSLLIYDSTKTNPYSTP